MDISQQFIQNIIYVIKGIKICLQMAIVVLDGA